MLSHELQFINLIRTALLGENDKLQLSDDIDFERILALSKKHSVLTMIFPLVAKIESASETVKNYFSYYSTCISQIANQQHCQKTLYSVFEEAKIPFLMVKGEKIRSTYPYPEMRTSSDIDIFYKAEDIDKVEQALKSIGFEKHNVFGAEISFQKGALLNVEMHGELDVYGDEHYYHNVWQKLIKITNYHHEFTDDDFYINVIIHTLKHFLNGGTGVRTVTDVYCLNKKLNLNRTYVDNELEKLGAKEFEKQLVNLSKVWFEGENSNEILDNLADYLLLSGVYGSIETYTVNASVNKKGKFQTFIARAFPPYKTMLLYYPSLKKVPFLLPFYWIAKLVKRLFTNPKAAKRSMDAISKMDMQKVEKQRNLFNNLKIKKSN